jgi:NodT family efflux transporter outer membrane factor (OMF) lipoprotein
MMTSWGIRTNIATRVLALAMATAGVVACAPVGPDYVRPPVAVPPAYKETGDSKSVEAKAPLPRERWWTLFGDPALNALVEQVELGNHSIQAVEARVRQAAALVNVAAAPMYPTAGVGTVNKHVGFAAAWEPDLWGRVRRSEEAGMAMAEATADELAAAKLSVQAQVAQRYFLLRIHDAELRLLRENVASYERSLQLNRNQYAVGVASRGNVVQAEAQLNATRAQMLDVELTRAQIEHSLAVLIGKPPAEFSLPATAWTAAIPAVAPTLPSELLLRRPDIAAAERKMAAANAQIGVAQAAYLPSVRFAATGAIGAAISGGVAILQAVLDGGLRDAQKTRFSEAYAETVALYRQAVLTAFREVEDSLVALRILEGEAAAQAVAARAARESVTITENQYKAGIVNYLSVVIVQSAALGNERAELAILGRRLIATVNLIEALGGGWEAEAPKTAGK